MHWYFVATSSPTIGYGHVARLRLLETEVAAAYPQARSTLLLHDAAKGEPSVTLGELASISAPAIVVIDGPDAFIDHLRAFPALRAEGMLVAAFRMYGVEDGDDYLEHVSLVPSFTPTELTRHPVHGHHLYRGKRLILVRRSVHLLTGTPKATPPRVVITMGAADPAGLTELAAEASLRLADELEIIVVVGALNPRYERIRARFAERLQIVRQGQVDFDELLRSASYAVISGGLTRYECVAAAVPFVSISLNAQQARFTEAVTGAGFGLHAGVAGSIGPAEVRGALARLVTDPELAEAMRRRAPGMIGADNGVELARFLHAASQGTWAAR